MEKKTRLNKISRTVTKAMNNTVLLWLNLIRARTGKCDASSVVMSIGPAFTLQQKQLTLIEFRVLNLSSSPISKPGLGTEMESCYR